jgi:hypothetical protein
MIIRAFSVLGALLLSVVRDDKTTRLIVREALKVYGGQVHAVEAFMETVPIGAGPGRD